VIHLQHIPARDHITLAEVFQKDAATLRLSFVSISTILGLLDSPVFRLAHSPWTFS
jgi:hypothetical protein